MLLKIQHVIDKHINVDSNKCMGKSSCVCVCGCVGVHGSVYFVIFG
jgi:hypothetical protein